MPSLLVEVDGRSWPAILASSSRRRGLILLASRLVVAGHPRPHSVTAGRGRPFSSSQRHEASQRRGRSWPAILVLTSQHHGLILPASRQVVARHPRPRITSSWPHPPSVTAGRGRPSSSSQHRGLVLPALLQVVASHPRHPSIVASSSQRHGRLWPANLNNNKRKDAAASAV